MRSVYKVKIIKVNIYVYLHQLYMYVWDQWTIYLIFVITPYHLESHCHKLLHCLLIFSYLHFNACPVRLWKVSFKSLPSGKAHEWCKGCVEYFKPWMTVDVKLCQIVSYHFTSIIIKKNYLKGEIFNPGHNNCWNTCWLLAFFLFNVGVQWCRWAPLYF